ncbi:MAG: prepilin-type N-terminal cleavage/methylation domain-containing protein [Planctomycetes bacterium]|nr:prepilin-type N-terminal cleavage/methylation domain-containing protein [Planctomycetota bacterium]
MRRGFTLLELMIVIAMIAVLIALAIPGLLAAQRSSNERSGSATLKVVGTAQADFRANDRDNNRIRDFWTLDIYALYAMYPLDSAGAMPADSPSVAECIRLVEPSVAGADGQALDAGSPPYGNVNAADSIGSFSPKAGYLYRMFSSQETVAGPATLLNDTDGGGSGYGLAHDREAFGVMAFPESLVTGRTLFIMSQDFVVYKYAAVQSDYVSNYVGGATATSNPLNTAQAAYFDSVTMYPLSPSAVGCSKLD